ncbi:glycosyltransferase family 2 protein [Pedobacter chitinilyticus]|nr:glycosyltransferase family 2 protein [Pedobacter chitinilyticus]
MVAKALVSIIIPSYNYANFIIETLTSIRGQKYEHWEAIVVDDGSTDNTEALVLELAKVDARIIYVYQENKGLSAARNTGIKKASGDYIQFLDADDLISEDKIQLQLDHFAADKNLGISYCNTYYFTNNNIQERYRSLDLTQQEWIIRLNDRPTTEQLWELVNRNIMPVNSPLVKREVVKKVGDFNTELTSLEDWEYWFKSAMYFKFGYLDNERAYGMVRVHHTSMSKDLKKMYLNEIVVRSLFQIYIDDAMSDSEEGRKLKKENMRLLKRPNSYFIAEEGFFNVKHAFQMIKKNGLKQFMSAYMKAINDFRKKNRA